ncbi:MAG: hypothetical protein MJ252_24010, partial [archaeon]|nr:hypothetical protein [archaeon]
NERERKVQVRNTKLLQKYTNKKEREEIDALKEQVMKLQEEMRSKEQRNKLVLERLKKQLEDAQKKNTDLKNEIKVYEDLKTNNPNSSQGQYNEDE